MTDIALATLIVDEVRGDLEEAATRILSLACKGLGQLRAPVDLDALEAAFTGLLEASSFQDLTGQKLDRLEALLTGRVEERPDSHLLNGPAGAEGLDQAAADRLFSGPDA